MRHRGASSRVRQWLSAYSPPNPDPFRLNSFSAQTTQRTQTTLYDFGGRCLSKAMQNENCMMRPGVSAIIRAKRQSRLCVTLTSQGRCAKTMWPNKACWDLLESKTPAPILWQFSGSASLCLLCSLMLNPPIRLGSAAALCLTPRPRASAVRPHSSKTMWPNKTCWDLLEPKNLATIVGPFSNALSLRCLGLLMLNPPIRGLTEPRPIRLNLSVSERI